MAIWNYERHSSYLSNAAKQLHNGNLIMPDVITCRDIALRKLTIMEAGPYPGGYEFESEAATCNQVSDPTKVGTDVDEDAAPRRGRVLLLTPSSQTLAVVIFQQSVLR